MKFKDGKTFSAYVRSKLHSSYITMTIGLAQGADALFDDSSPFQGLNLLLNPRIMFEGEGIQFLTYRWAVTCINVHSYQLGMTNVFIIY